MFGAHQGEEEQAKKVEEGTREVYKDQRPLFPSQVSDQLYPILLIPDVNWITLEKNKK